MDHALAERFSRHFLGVDRSVTGRAWTERCTDPRLALAIAQRAGVPDVLGRVLAARGVTPDAATDWLDPRLRRLMPPPDTFADMETGAARLARAIRDDETIGIIGDYDVDGTCSAAMLSAFLEACGARPKIHIPHRLREGYGPSRSAVDSLADGGVRLLVTLDCGAMSHDALQHAASRGLETIVVDHHQMGAALPPAAAVINPNRPDDASGQGHLCAAGVTFVLMAATARRLDAEEHWSRVGRSRPDLLQWLDLVALATVCDVVPLKGLNRAYVRQGLRVMAARARPGLAALADVARLSRPPDVHALGFVLGPRINAAGRIGHAGDSLALLRARGWDEARRLAARLEDMNRTRQEMEARFVDAAILQAERQLETEGRRPLVVFGEDWHPGVVGLVAARLKERFNLPAVAFGLPPDVARAGEPAMKGGTEAPLATGSARSVTGVDIGRAVARAVAEGVLERGGGHAMAAGMTCKADRIDAFRDWLAEALDEAVSALPERPELRIDAALSAGGASVELIEMLERAGPYGSGNPSPVFALPAHVVEWADVVGDRHVRVSLRAGDGARLRGIAFRAVGSPLGNALLDGQGRPMHVAGRLVVDDWNGARRPRLLIVDAAAVR